MSISSSLFVVVFNLKIWSTKIQESDHVQFKCCARTFWTNTLEQCKHMELQKNCEEKKHYDSIEADLAWITWPIAQRVQPYKQINKPSNCIPQTTDIRNLFVGLLNLAEAIGRASFYSNAMSYWVFFSLLRNMLLLLLLLPLYVHFIAVRSICFEF